MPMMSAAMIVIPAESGRLSQNGIPTSTVRMIDE